MPEEMLFIFKDLRDAWTALEAIDFAKPAFFGLWLTILLMPLKGIDRRDILSAMVYSLFCMAAAAILIFILPENFSPPAPMPTILSTMIVLGMLAIGRWYFHLGTVRELFKAGNEKGKNRDAKKE